LRASLENSCSILFLMRYPAAISPRGEPARVFRRRRYVSPKHGSGSDAEAKFLFRFGIGYSVELGKGFSIMPNIDIDLVRENPALVFGVGLGKNF